MITTIMIAAAAGVCGAGLGYISGLVSARKDMAVVEEAFRQADEAAETWLGRYEDAQAKLTRLTDRDPKTGRFVKREVV